MVPDGPWVFLLGYSEAPGVQPGEDHQVAAGVEPGKREKGREKERKRERDIFL